MKILSLKLSHFGKFNQKEIELREGLNVICGDNEAGKTTIHAFIGGMLFGIERLRGRAGKEDKYIRYQPWDTPGAYQGSMEFEHEGKHYRLDRVFYQKERSCMLTELETGRNIPLPDGKITGLIPELTESVYKNTVSIEQLHARTDSELADSVRNYIANMTLSKSEEVDVKGALTVLSDTKKRLEQQYALADTEAIEHRIEDCLEKEQEAEKYAERSRNITAELDHAKKELDAYLASDECRDRENAEKYPVFREKYNIFKSMAGQLEASKSQLAKLQDITGNPDSIDEEINEYEQTLEKLEKLHKARLDIENDYDEETPDNITIEETPLKIYSSSSVMLAAIGILVCIIFNKWFVPGIIVGICLVILGIILQFRSYMKYKEQQKRFHELQEENGRRKKQAEEAAELYRQTRREAAAAEQDFITENGSYEDLRKKITTKTAEKASVQSNMLRRTQFENDIREYSERMEKLASEIAAYGDGFIRGGTDILPDDEYMDRLYKEIETRLSSIKKKTEDMKALVSSLQHELERIEWELSRYSENEDILFESVEKKKELVQVRQEAEKESSAVSLAIETIKELAADIHDSFGRELNRTISEKTGQITDGAHENLFIDEELNTSVMTGTSKEGIERFSTGTIDQVYLALRLAIADMFFEQNDIPLIFDDTFAYYDDSRLEATLDYLAKQENSQIILFSCHDREKNILQKKRIPYHEIRLEG